MPLSDLEIRKALADDIWIAYRQGKRIGAEDLTINPHSVNVSLSGRIIRLYPESDRYGIDLHDASTIKTIEWDIEDNEDGLVLYPGVLYLASVREHFDCDCLIQGKFFYQNIDGRSTCGRVGMCVHQTAGRGDYGFKAPFTLEITVVNPIRVRYGDEIAQIYFDSIEGWGVGKPYNGTYSEQTGPQVPSLGRERFRRHD